ncbi:hypothetical protein PAPHI01_1999 [Pancytospora philotis]|nr:hypothetical protein PAPHI01_1999 [Pancytospora philotis]
MDIYSMLSLLLMLFLPLLSLNGSPIAEAQPISGASSRANRDSDKLDRLLAKVAELAMAEDRERKIDGMLFWCYYPGQPVVPKSERVNGSRPILHGLCESDIFIRDAAERTRRHHRGRRLRSADQDREEHNEKAASNPSEANDSEGDNRLYSVLNKAQFTLPSAYKDADPTTAAAVQPTFAAADPDDSGSEQEEENNISVMYDEMWNPAPFIQKYDESDGMVTPFGRYFLKSRRFAHFLATWEKNDENANFYISQADVARILDEVEVGAPFSSLSRSNKRRFTKLAFVRNTLEMYGLMRVAMRPLGLEFGRHRTAAEFLQAMYGYLMAVHGSNGRLEVALPVTVSILSGELFSLAYAGCSQDKIFYSKNGKEVALEHHLANKARQYIEHVIILFNAWTKSFGSDAIDHAVLLREARRIYNYVNSARSYDDGCQQPAGA